MSGLLGPSGKPISSRDLTTPSNKKAAPPATGEGFGSWAGRDISFMTLPGGGVVQFDLSKLTLQDYRLMRDHYQINNSLAVMSFMQHQADWHIECEDKKIAEFCQEQISNIWTQLNRSLSAADWAGYAPNGLNWDNDTNKRAIVISKVKDLIPEECRVHWKEVEAWAPEGKIKPKVKIYDGIRQVGYPYPIPVENSLWYPLLMENGDYYGKKLLKPAFTSWFFSILMHLFANRYYERFGEPTPIGRAPFEDEVPGNTNGKMGNQYMLEVLTQLRSRGVLVLPNDRTQDSTTGRPSYDYDIEYLESQMRGADFERYMTRLDEEMSIGLFTPILLMRTADVGSYNLGTAHSAMYSNILNAKNDDRADYINKYVLRKMVNYNFSEKAPDAKIVFRRLGTANAELLKDILLSLLAKGGVKVDIAELGKMTGMTLEEVKQTVQDEPGPDEEVDPGEGTRTPGPSAPPGGGKKTSNVTQQVITAICDRVRPQVENAFKDGKFGEGFKPTLGYKRRMEACITDSGMLHAEMHATNIYKLMDSWLADIVCLGTDEFENPTAFMELFKSVLNNVVRDAVGR